MPPSRPFEHTTVRCELPVPPLLPEFVGPGTLETGTMHNKQRVPLAPHNDEREGSHMRHNSPNLGGGFGL